MHTAKGCIEEVFLEGRHAARISCPQALVPAPGQYLLVLSSSDNDPVLAQPVFSSGACPGGFFAAQPLPFTWLPGVELNMRGPLGKGFSLPPAARRVLLAAPGGNCARLLALLEPALSQGASVTLLASQPPDSLPAALEILPLNALLDTLPWADYLACDLRRSQLQEISILLAPLKHDNFTHFQRVPPRPMHVQLLVETPLPCAGLADCGACAVRLGPRDQIQLACKDGPVFDLF